uniref:Glycosyl transferase n=1 Tax=Chlorobium chlorochromatii (strain CaD3) TaxID=340177 RepID=Q3AQJ1_CHLCH
MREYLISVIIAVYNPNAIFLQKAIQSVLNQSFPVLELILVNDGGNEEFRNLLPTDSRIKVFRKVNEGVALARNYAIQQSQGEYIAFLDQDDYWFPHKLEKQISMIPSDQPQCFVVSPIQIIDSVGSVVDKNNLAATSLYKNNLSLVNPFLGLCYGNYIYSSTPLIHKKVFEIVGLFDVAAQPHDDWDMYLRILYAGVPFFRYTDSALSVWRIHDSNESHKIKAMLLSKCYVEKKLLELNLVAPVREVVTINLLFDNVELAHLFYKENNTPEFRFLMKRYLPSLIRVFFVRFNKTFELDKILFRRIRKIILKSFRRYIVSFLRCNG